MWVRGLKPWLSLHIRLKSLSHPMWVRGLKPRLPRNAKKLLMSHPMWVRGLKLFNSVITTTRKSRTLCGCVD